MAFFNGIGYESWENVWGIWNGITPRCGGVAAGCNFRARPADFLISPDWRPYYPTQNYGVFASEFPVAAGDAMDMVNRSQFDMERPGDAGPLCSRMHYYDFYHGTELTPERNGDKRCSVFTSKLTDMQPFSRPDRLPTKHSQADADHEANDRAAAGSFDHEWRLMPQQIVPMEATKALHRSCGHGANSRRRLLFRVHGIEIEGENDIGVDVQYPWEDSPRRYTPTKCGDAFSMDRYPVTNAQFKNSSMHLPISPPRISTS